MAVNLTYDPSNDPDTIEAEDQRDAESLEVGEKLEEEQQQLLAGKYKDAEELESAYIELQKKLGGDQSDTEEESDVVTEESKTLETLEDFVEEYFPEDATAKTLIQANQELLGDGITDATMEQLNEMTGAEFLEAMRRVDEKAPQGYFEAPGMEEESTNEPVGLSDSDVSEIQNAVGGADAYREMTQWAENNFTTEEIQAYDGALESGDLNSINFALQALYYRYQDSVGYDGEMIQGKPAEAVDGFRSQQEVVRAMSDPRYEDDPAYRQDVYNKLERSQIKF
jgi:hypothetical protein